MVDDNLNVVIVLKFMAVSLNKKVFQWQVDSVWSFYYSFSSRRIFCIVL